MSSVTTAHGAVGAGTAILIKNGKSFTYSLTGTHNATVRFESSGSGGASWDLIEQVETTATIAPTTLVNNSGKDLLYRSNCTVYASGTATANIKDTTEEVIGVGGSSTSGVTVFEKGDGVTKQTYLECNAVTVTISDDAAVAQFGGVKVYDFPEGVTYLKGAMVTGILTAGVTGTIIDNWDGDVALGTATATTGATLTGTEADIMPSVAVSAGASDKDGVVSAQSVATALTESGARWFDGTSTAIDLFLNFVIDDDATHTAGTAEFTGTIVINWEMMGDF
jgi:hypothetical protein